jgi:hypothetical protein
LIYPVLLTPLAVGLALILVTLKGLAKVPSPINPALSHALSTDTDAQDDDGLDVVVVVVVKGVTVVEPGPSPVVLAVTQVGAISL